MLWACILLPQLAMDSALRQRSNPDAPLALLGGPAQRRQLQAVNPAARALGLKPGQSLVAAQALSRDFATAEYDLAAVERWQAFLAAWAYGFSSQVSLHYPRALLLEVQSSLALFGPWPRFEARLRKELTALGFRHRLCLAPNPVAARVLANSHDGLAIEDETALQRASCPPFRWTAWDSRGSWPSPSDAWDCAICARSSSCRAPPWPVASRPNCCCTSTASAAAAHWRWSTTGRRTPSTCASNSISTWNRTRPCSSPCDG
nr:DNA polymerase Y family protein [Pseudomonas aeruginosa]